MALIMNADQRAKTLEDYNPSDHLIDVGKSKDGKQVKYYPAAWRLYELHLRYPNANFKSEIIHHDEKGMVIVKAYLYLGASYEASDKKAEAMKQGFINALDKVETAAKARCARDFGIGTEYALDMVPDETDATHNAPTLQSQQNDHRTAQLAQAVNTPTGQQKAANGHSESIAKPLKEYIQEVYKRGGKAGLYANSVEFQEFIKLVLGLDVAIPAMSMNEQQAHDVDAEIAQRIAQLAKAS